MLCLVARYFAPGFPNPTMSFILIWAIRDLCFEDFEFVAEGGAFFLDCFLDAHAIEVMVDAFEALGVVGVGHVDELFDAFAGDAEDFVVVFFDDFVDFVGFAVEVGFEDGDLGFGNFFDAGFFFLFFLAGFCELFEGAEEEFFEAGAGHSGDGENFAELFDFFENGFEFVGREEVDFVEGGDLGGLAEGFVEFFEFLVDGFVVFEDVFAGGVEDVDEEFGAGDVFEEFVAEAAAFAGALDQAGDVGDDEALVFAAAEFVEVNNAEVGNEGGEVVGGDFWFGIGDDGDESGFAGGGKADDGDVGDEAEFEEEFFFFAGFTAFGEFGGLVSGADETGVA